MHRGSCAALHRMQSRLWWGGQHTQRKRHANILRDMKHGFGLWSCGKCWIEKLTKLCMCCNVKLMASSWANLATRGKFEYIPKVLSDLLFQFSVCSFEVLHLSWYFTLLFFHCLLDLFPSLCCLFLIFFGFSFHSALLHFPRSSSVTKCWDSRNTSWQMCWIWMAREGVACDILAL